MTDDRLDIGLGGGQAGGRAQFQDRPGKAVIQARQPRRVVKRVLHGAAGGADAGQIAGQRIVLRGRAVFMGGAGRQPQVKRPVRLSAWQR